MSSRINDTGQELAPLGQEDRHGPLEVAELSWRGLQAWICGVALSWPAAPGWYLIDWGDGTTSTAHPDMGSRQHTYGWACDNATYTVTVRTLHRDGTTGPVLGSATVQSRGRGVPGHKFYQHDDGRTVTLTLGPEKPRAHTIDWGDGTPVEALDEGVFMATHTYTTPTAFTPQVGILDRPAQRLMWMEGPSINPKKHNREYSMGTFSSRFTVSSSWDGGYTASYRVTHEKTDGGGTNALPWEMSFVLEEPAVIADVWGAGVAKTSDLHRAADHVAAAMYSTDLDIDAEDGDLAEGSAPAQQGHAVPPLAVYNHGVHAGARTYVIRSSQPLPVGSSVDVGFRVEPAGSPLRQPKDCSINGHPCFNDQTPAPDPDPGPDDDTQPPGQPTDLTVKSSGPRTLSLGWTEPAQGRRIAVYDVSVDGDITTHVPAPATSGTITGLNPETTYEVRVRARDHNGNTSAWSNTVQGATTAHPSTDVPLPWNIPVAPFVDLCAWLNDNGDGMTGNPNLARFQELSGVKAWNLGFIVQNGWDHSTLQPTWGGQGSYAVKDAWGRDNIKALKDAGGTPIISFGGENGSEIANHAKDVDELVAAYQNIIDTYGTDHVDFDIEGGEQTKHDVLARRSAAIARLQHNNPDLKVAFTLPVLPEGLVPDGLNVLRVAVEHGVKISVVNVMSMCFNRHNADMGDLVIQSADSVHAQLAEFYPDESARDRWKRVSICPMYGQNNDGTVFSLDHAKRLADYATHRGFTLTGWDATRDRNACLSQSLYACTNVEQEPFGFAKVFKAHQDATPSSGTKKAA